MKKIITVFLSGATIFFAATGNATAQRFGNNVATSGLGNTPSLTGFDSEGISMEKSSASSTKESVMSAETELNASKAKLKALKATNRATANFSKMHKDAPETTWSIERKAIVATFKKDAVRTRVIYDRKGSWTHSLSFYPPSETPGYIRSIIEEVYPNADITVAVQFKNRDLELFILQLEDKRTIKKVTVYNGETKLIEEFTRQVN